LICRLAVCAGDTVFYRGRAVVIDAETFIGATTAGLEYVQPVDGDARGGDGEYMTAAVVFNAVM